MKPLRVACLMLLLLIVPATPLLAAPSPVLAQLLKDYDEANLRLHPSTALWRGDTRYLDRYEDDLTAAYLVDAHKNNTDFKTRLNAIDRAKLDAEDQLSYDIFAWQLDDDARLLAPGIAEHFQMLPIDQFNGAQVRFPTEMEWRGKFPFRTAADYEKAAHRMKGFAHWIDTAIARMREGMAEGVTQPRVIVERMIPQAEEQANKPVEDSVFYAAIRNMPASIKGGTRTRLAAEYRDVIAGTVIPAYRRLASFLKTEYLPKARTSVGLGQMPGGKEMYLALVRHHTTLTRAPEEIHTLGLQEVARIRGEMERVKRETGFEGTLAQFADYLRHDPRFKFKDRDAMMAAYQNVKIRIAKGLPRLFGRLPKAPYEIAFFQPFVAPTQAAADYEQASADGSRIAIFHINAYDLPSRPTYTTEALSLHESMPGHHLQLALQQENTALPDFRRFDGPNAFVEGWGLYAESLGRELGLYTDPYQYFGMLSFDAWRACRLVVDTGMHWQGWSEEQAIAYILNNTALTRTDIVTEVERYIAYPAQALAYKSGQIDFLALRKKAEEALGKDFDIRAFHDALLAEGAMPLTIENARMDMWIAAQQGVHEKSR